MPIPVRPRLALLLATTVLTATALTAAPPAGAQDRQTQDRNRGSAAFELGEIVIVGRRSERLAIGGTSLSDAAIYRFNRPTLDEAASLVPGVTASNSGGSRNERLISVRGFDRFQVPLSIDGIRVYLPADNRLDFGRFLTADVAEVQIAKGYASVLDGPGGMGGAINLVTRRPTEEIELEASATVTLDRDTDFAGKTLFGLAGTRQQGWYAQVSAARNDRDHYTLPKDFTPTATEDGGRRNRSETEDWRVNAKVGLTPNDTDEYSLSYTRQEGSKNAPLHVTDPASIQRYWRWPYWDLDSLYFLSSTRIGTGTTLKTRAYYNGFDNLLQAFDDAAQTRQTLGRAFDSYYDDEAYGGSLELTLPVADRDTLAAAVHYRRDRHGEWQTSFSPSRFTEPEQVSTEETWSVALENRLSLTPTLLLTAGLGYDWRDLKRAEDWAGGATGSPVIYPTRDSDAWNWQAALSQSLGDDAELHARLSSRTRFPTLFERFSSRFGGATSNPDLKPERATNIDLGGSWTTGALSVEAAVFYNDVDDYVVSVPFIYNGQSVTQSRNVGSGEFYGAELSLAVELAQTLTVGGNYALVKRHIDDPTNAALKPTGVPTHTVFLYADWTPLPDLRLTPTVEVAGERWTATTDGRLYYRTGAHTLVGLRADYSLTDTVEVGAGVRNLFDRSYQLTDGFPEAGRSFYLSARARL
ncbi:TonB-dependent receptor plug domain-containing protein [Rhodocista pekingensis]|uniref:TonB-dependent receptor plug domain-containing protein n=1 Tax=Rhodocista pekingensis TaxID=201185 RepID=A0ABW2L181_9PROT